MTILVSCDSKDANVKNNNKELNYKDHLALFGDITFEENEFIKGEWLLKEVNIYKSFNEEDEKKISEVKNIKVLIDDRGIKLSETGNYIALRKPKNNGVFIFNSLDTINGNYSLQKVNFFKGKHFILRSGAFLYYKNDSLIGRELVYLYFVRDKVPDFVKKYLENKNNLPKKKDTIISFE